MQIETFAVETLRPYARNARTHSNKQIRQIAKSIQRFGFCNPVLIDDQGQIIAGHGRVAAAKLLGIKEVPTVKLGHLSDAEKRAYILADNRLAEKAGWDREILAIELQALVSLDFEGPFAGSGTLMIAAERTGRRARALEIDCHYVDVAVRRWEDYTGKAAASG
jgi:ParB-like chromosome segregation protein Spo0J